MIPFRHLLRFAIGSNTKIRSIVCIAIALVPLTTVPAAADRPNVLVCIADDWSWPYASITGEPELSTPTFDRVAREGLHFAQAFASAPSCTASRGALLTGQYHWRLREAANLHSSFPNEIEVYPDVLARHGYHVGQTRKGWGPGKANAGGRTTNPAGPRFADFDEFMTRREPGQPFCFWFGSVDPHRPYEKGSGVRAGKNPEKVRVPPTLPDHPVTRNDILDYFLEIERFDREVGEILAKLEKAGELENTIVVITADNGWPFPRGKATVYDAGTHVPLAIRWPKGIETPGRKFDQPTSLTDLAPTFLEAAGVSGLPDRTGSSLLPIFRNPEKRPELKFVLTGMERHVACRDLGPDVPGGGYPMRAIRTKDHVLIRNFEPGRWPMGDWKSVKDDGSPGPGFDRLADSTFVAFGDCDASPSKAFMIVNRDRADIKLLFDSAFRKRPEWELYDLANDPYERRNLAADPAYAGIFATLKSEMEIQLKATNDPRAFGQGNIFDRYEYLGNVSGSDQPKGKAASERAANRSSTKDKP
jgi:N-sulfoglucosamine sulfohydrolase